MQKIRLLYWFVLEIWLVKKSCNLIGWEHFDPYLWNKNFAGLDNCRILQRIVQDRANNISFYYRINSVNFSINPKNRFWSISPIFGAKKISWENPALSCTTSYRFLAPWQNLEKTKIQFQENVHTDRRTDKSYFTGPFRLPLVVQKDKSLQEGDCFTPNYVGVTKIFKSYCLSI